MRLVEVAGGLSREHSQSGDSPSAGPSWSDPHGPEATAEQHGFTAQLRDVMGARRARNLAHLQDERAAVLPSGESVKSVRKAGSKHAVSDLQQRLGDDWALLRGYHNSRGPIGQLLIGPTGLIAMTSVYVEATVHCRGERWHAEKEGRDGQHQDIHLTDLDGRSVSVELNQCADELEELLRAAGVKVSIERVVLLNHPRSQLGGSFRPSVHIFTSTADLVTWLHQRPKTLDRGAKRQLEELISRRSASSPE